MLSCPAAVRAGTLALALAVVGLPSHVQLATPPAAEALARPCPVATDPYHGSGACRLPLPVGQAPVDYAKDWGSDPAGYSYYASGSDGEGAYPTTCRPLTYRVAIDGLASREADMLLGDLFTVTRRITVATGQEFTYLGTSEVVPWVTDLWWTDDVAGDVDMLFGVSDWTTAPVLVGNLAVTGNDVVDDGPTGQPTTIHRSGTTFDASLFDSDRHVREAVVTHEIGHALGLGHTDSPHQIMNAKSDPWHPVAVLQAGDLAGLAALRATHPCA